VTDTYVTDISHFLDEEGYIIPESGTALRFAEYLTSIISMISHPPPLPEEFKVKCRRRPNRKPCKGIIEGDTDPDTDVIIWWCPECLENGFISNWQDTIWDLSDAWQTHH
jgi:hypothetical protein